ncbi:MAG: hypothetical protein K0V04_19390 [Deltaproteobacteria bacterium]|nr:hypothetical protein [Deltaproteobacteria bacterium]
MGGRAPGDGDPSEGQASPDRGDSNDGRSQDGEQPSGDGRSSEEQPPQERRPSEEEQRSEGTWSSEQAQPSEGERPSEEEQPSEDGRSVEDAQPSEDERPPKEEQPSEDAPPSEGPTSASAAAPGLRASTTNPASPTAPEVSNAGPTSPSDLERRPPRSWFRDPLGVTLVATGTAVVASGAVAWGLGRRDFRRAPVDGSERRYERLAARGRGRVTLGVSLIGVGSALALGGALRLVWVARRPHWAVMPWGSPGGGGVAAATRF